MADYLLPNLKNACRLLCYMEGWERPLAVSERMMAPDLYGDWDDGFLSKIYEEAHSLKWHMKQRRRIKGFLKSWDIKLKKTKNL